MDPINSSLFFFGDSERLDGLHAWPGIRGRLRAGIQRKATRLALRFYI